MYISNCIHVHSLYTIHVCTLVIKDMYMYLIERKIRSSCLYQHIIFFSTKRHYTKDTCTSNMIINTYNSLFIFMLSSKLGCDDFICNSLMS